MRGWWRKGVQLFQLDQLVQLFRQFFERHEPRNGDYLWRAKSAVRFKGGQLGQDGQDGQLGTHIFTVV
jgi:hypothetical protein